MVQRNDHGSRAQKEEALEERVGEQVKHRHVRHRGDARSQDHVAQLRDGRVGKDALDVVLLRRHEAGGQAGDRANPCNDVPGNRGSQEKRENPGEHIDTRGNHRCRVEQRGNRRRTFHGIGKPHVKGKLGGFSDCSAEDKNASDGQEVALRFQKRHFRENLSEDDGTGREPQHEDSEHEAEVADAVYDERLFAGVRGGCLAVVVPDENVRASRRQAPRR